MSATDIEFASLLCSRLCHDLMSPVGAFANGLELLADESDPELRAQYVDLLAASARASTAKLKFFRLAFGAAGGLGDQIDANELKAALEALFAERKDMTLGWMVDVPMLAKPVAKILLNLALIAGESLLRGGRVDIGVEAAETGGLEMVVRAEGPRLKLDSEIRDRLAGQSHEPLGSRTIGAGMVVALLAMAGGSLRLSEPGEGVLLIGVRLEAGQ